MSSTGQSLKENDDKKGSTASDEDSKNLALIFPEDKAKDGDIQEILEDNFNPPLECKEVENRNGESYCAILFDNMYDDPVAEIYEEMTGEEPEVLNQQKWPKVRLNSF